MRFRSDDRAAAIQVGAVILFGFIIIAMTLYQVQVVPQQNEGIEFNHNQEVQGDMNDLRGGIVSAVGGDDGQSVSVDLGTTFPSRTLFINPPPAFGTLRTAGERDLVVAFATATDTDVDDYWNGTNRSVETKGFVYTPDYRVYDQAPVTVYENTLLYNRHRDANLTVSDQRLVRDRTITIVSLMGNYSETGIRRRSVDVSAISSSSNTVSVVGNDTDNVTLVVPTALDNETWSSVLESEYYDPSGSGGGYIVNQSYRSSTNELVVVLHEDGEPYTLRMAKVGVGTGAEEEPYRYVTAVKGDGATVQEGGTIEIVVEARDAFNNPVGSVLVYNSTDSSKSSVTAKTNNRTNTDGEVVLKYHAPPDINGTTTKMDFVNVSIGNDDTGLASFDADNATNLTMTVVIENTDGSGIASGGFNLEWDTEYIEQQTGIKGCYSSNNTCVYNVSDDSNGKFPVIANTTPETAGVFVDFSINNTTIGSFNPSEDNTDGTGNASSELSVNSAGTANLFASSVSDSDTLILKVNAQGSDTGPTADFTYTPSNPAPGESISFDASSSTGTSISSYDWDWTGDGTYDGSGKTASHTYSSSGTYSVDLLVTESDGDTDTVTKGVTVASGSAPTINIDNINDQSTDCDRNNGGNCRQQSSPTAKFQISWSGSDTDGDIMSASVRLFAPDGTQVNSTSYTYSGKGSISETTTLSENPGTWQGDYTVEVTVTDSNGQSTTVSQVETADGA